MKKIIICISLLCLLILSCKQNKAEITKVEPKENVVFENRVLTKKNTLKTFSPEYFDY
jgi:PBP1b-binding outer membrane lipoprotein LpoB